MNRNLTLEIRADNPSGFYFFSAPEKWTLDALKGLAIVSVCLGAASLFTKSQFVEGPNMRLLMYIIFSVYMVILLGTIVFRKYFESDRDYDGLLEREALANWWNDNSVHPRFFIQCSSDPNKELLVTVFRGANPEQLESELRSMLRSSSEQDIQDILAAAKI